MDIQAYLNRIDYRGPLAPTAETLRQLQVAHLLTVPFENLSIHAREPIVLEDEALFQKIVNRRRGGFCYELNGLFAALLRALGFEVAMLSAQVANAEGEFSRDFDHMALMITIEERWLADVGFGDSFVEPLRLNERDVQVQGDRAYRIVADDERLIVQRADNGNDWKAQYRFTLDPYQYPDYAEMCEYHQTSPLSHFTQARICSLLTPQGRISLSDMRLITTEPGERHERTAATQEEYEEMLRELFGIVM
ncbi:MAG TPA: arylamine N-acetyltransferase [Pyrinomonadaceae bacterium]|nr:arylamine N-acetyltransferase [Pyrinomonadaceae bacterium]